MRICVKDLVARFVSKNKTILVTAQDPKIRNLIVRDLSCEGYRTITASSAEEAVRIAARHDCQIDFLCTDTQLPSLSGSELAQIVALDYPNLQVVYLSNDTKAATRPHGQRSQAVTVQNPWRGDDLREVIRETLNRERNKASLKGAAHSFFSGLGLHWAK